MNIFARILVVAMLTAIAQTYLPWWSSVCVALVVEALLGKDDRTSFYTGFYGVSIPWMIFATYIDMKSESILTVRILDLFSLPQFSIVMIVLTGLIGGLAGGVGSMTGGWIKAAFSRTDGNRK